MLGGNGGGARPVGLARGIGGGSRLARLFCTPGEVGEVGTTSDEKYDDSSAGFGDPGPSRDGSNGGSARGAGPVGLLSVVFDVALESSSSVSEPGVMGPSCFVVSGRPTAISMIIGIRIRR
jgi:hypothetical protein